MLLEHESDLGSGRACNRFAVQCGGLEKPFAQSRQGILVETRVQTLNNFCFAGFTFPVDFKTDDHLTHDPLCLRLIGVAWLNALFQLWRDNAGVANLVDLIFLLGLKSRDYASQQ